jgi:hypothetical protein
MLCTGMMQQFSEFSAVSTENISPHAIKVVGNQRANI